MKAFDDTYFSFENSEEFRPFNERELAIIMGGGGEEQFIDFLHISNDTSEDNGYSSENS